MLLGLSLQSIVAIIVLYFNTTPIKPSNSAILPGGTQVDDLEPPGLITSLPILAYL